MKKLLIVLAITLTLFPISAYAVEGPTGGVKLGLNLANARGDVEDEIALWAGGGEWDKKTKTGFVFGGFVEYAINDNFSIQPELLYSQKGVKTEAPGYVTDYWGYIYDAKIKLTFIINYLEIPVLAKLSKPTQGNVKPFFLIGPAVALKLSAKVKAEIQSAVLSDSDEEDISDDVKSIDFGLVVGAGIDYKLATSGKLTVDGRYTLGLTPIFDIEGYEPDAKNAVISFMVGYSFL